MQTAEFQRLGERVASCRATLVDHRDHAAVVGDVAAGHRVARRCRPPFGAVDLDHRPVRIEVPGEQLEHGVGRQLHRLLDLSGWRFVDHLVGHRSGFGSPAEREQFDRGVVPGPGAIRRRPEAPDRREVGAQSRLVVAHDEVTERCEQVGWGAERHAGRSRSLDRSIGPAGRLGFERPARHEHHVAQDPVDVARPLGSDRPVERRAQVVPLEAEPPHPLVPLLTATHRTGERRHRHHVLEVRVARRRPLATLGQLPIAELSEGLEHRPSRGTDTVRTLDHRLGGDRPDDPIDLRRRRRDGSS